MKEGLKSLAIPFRDSFAGARLARRLAAMRMNSSKAKLVPRLSRIFER